MRADNKQNFEAPFPAESAAGIDAVVDFEGEKITLLADRAAWWPSASAVFIADLHVGKEATFRAAGLPVPDLFAHDLARLAAIVARLNPRQLYVLGDLFHAKEGHTAELMRTFLDWRRGVHDLEITLVRGNHDRRAGDPPANWLIECVDEPISFRHFQLRHCPQFNDQIPTFAGHLHPKYRLSFGPDHLRLPCFLRRRNTLVLPAFGEFIDHDTIEPEPNDSVFIIANAEVVPIALPKITKARTFTHRARDNRAGMLAIPTLT
jgi:DNA ligase-associated metallophosphoesterase